VPAEALEVIGMRKIGAKRMGAGLALGLVLGLTVTMVSALPASASALATAQLTTPKEVLSGGAGGNFGIRVNNTEPAGGPLGLDAGRTINYVLITPPIDMVDAVAASAPSGWTVDVFGSDPAHVEFKGGSIAPGGNATFNITGDVQRVANDLADNWLIRVSSNGGQSTLSAAASSPGALETTIRILQVLNVAIVAPALAADDRDGDGVPEVTGTQSGVCSRMRVLNAGSQSKNVTASLTGSNVTVTDTNCASNGIGAKPIPGNDGQADFDFSLAFADVSSRTTTTLTGAASAPGATTPSPQFTATRSVVIEPLAILSYVAGSITPRAVVPGTSGQVFSIQLNKTPGGSPPVSPVNLAFSSAFCNSGASTSLGAGVQNGVVIEFTCNVANISDGRYTPTITYGYTDGNGISVSGRSLGTIDQITLDRLIPSVLPEIVPPAPQVNANPPVDPALTSGQAFQVRGPVRDTDPADGQSKPCHPNGNPLTNSTKCTLISAELIELGNGGGEIGRKPLNGVSINGSGELAGNPSVAFTAGTVAAVLQVTVQDEAGLRATNISEMVDVDLIAPDIASAEVRPGPGSGQRRIVRVVFTEPVQNSNNMLDWTIQDGQQKLVLTPPVQSADKRTVELTTSSDFDFDPSGTLTYDPNTLNGNAYHDRVGLEIGTPKQKSLVDRINPLAPVFNTVAGRAVQDDGKFHFNTDAPSVALGNPGSDNAAIRAGYEVRLFEEANGQPGLQVAGDRDLGCGDVAEGTAIELTGCDFSGADRQAEVYAVSTDVNNNLGTERAASLVLDRVRPVLANITVAGTTVNVAFSEDLVDGRDFSADWHFFTLRQGDGKRTEVNVQEVSPGASNNVRSLAVDSFGSNTPFEVRYLFRGAEADRYVDRAGNSLLDFTGLI
jgi:hypothetical protein